MTEPFAETCNSLAESAEHNAHTNRRAVLTAGAAAGLMLAASKLQAQEGPEVREVLFDLNDNVSINSAEWRNPALRLARRITYGPARPVNAQIRALGFAGYLNQQLNPTAIDDTACEQFVRENFPRVFMTYKQTVDLGDGWRVWTDLTEALFYRMAFSKRQLYWRMVEFWMDHFNVQVWKPGPELYQPMLRDVIQRHAMGNFTNLLRGIVHSPAMLVYLDNTEGFGNNPNINFARELLELHTIGVDGGQRGIDIRQLSLILTGWTFWWDGPSKGAFRFEEWRHATGSKTVLGRTFPYSGKPEGDQVIDFLAAHPNTARYVSKKLLRWFLSYEPTTAQVNAVAAEFTRTRGDIKSVLRIILTQANIMAAPPKLKRPLHFMISALRSTEAWSFESWWSLRHEHLDSMGMVPTLWEMPDGYPDKLEFWAPGIIPRLNFAMRMGNNRVWGVRTDIERQIGQTRDPARVLNVIREAFFANEMPVSDANSLWRYLKARPLNSERIRGAIALAIGSHGFQWY
jgi:hypothetical protein